MSNDLTRTRREQARISNLISKVGEAFERGDDFLTLHEEDIEAVMDLYHAAEGMGEMVRFTSGIAAAHAREAERWRWAARVVAVASLLMVVGVVLFYSL